MKIDQDQKHRKVAKVLDDAFTIPGTKIKIGLDPIIGLVPGFGDVLGGIISLYFLWEGSRRKLPTVILIRMAFNIILEVAIGSIPFLGDIFDVSWKANRRNSDLIEKYSDEQTKTTILSTIIVWVIFLVTVFLVIGIIAGILSMLGVIFDRLSGDY